MVILLLLLIQVFIVHKLSKTVIWVYLTLEISLQKYNFVINLTMINVLLWSKDITWYHKLLNNTKLSEALVRKISHLVYIFHNNNSNIIFMGFVTKIILGKKIFLNCNSHWKMTGIPIVLIFSLIPSSQNLIL